MADSSKIDRGKRDIAMRNSEVVDLASPTSSSRIEHPARLGDEILLQRIPFAVLLPSLGQSSDLKLIKANLKLRYEKLQSEKGNSAPDASRVIGAESAMLMQVLQWLEDL